MNEQRITPRSSAFPRPARDAALSPDAAAEAARAEAARAASVELAVHGDPSLRRDAAGGGQASAKDKRLRVDWVRPADLTARLSAGGLALSGRLNMHAHRFLRAQAWRGVKATARTVRHLPPLNRFGRSQSPAAPTRSVPTR